MALKEEILAKKKDIVVDAYAMSIGEIANLYKDDELDVHPEFQRFFRWDDNQKTRLIESILLGIPLPPIFVSQKMNGKWDVIDGQQRLSTILQFLGYLKADDGTQIPPLKLKKAKFLPSLEGVEFGNEIKFPSDLKITFKREKLNITIIKETGENDSSKYEMFQRLNTGGTHLSPQEIRNCLLIMQNRSLYEIIRELNDLQEFSGCIALSENQLEEQFNLELVVKALLFTTFTNEDLSNYDKSRNMDEFITEKIENFATENDLGEIDTFKQRFHKCFILLNSILHEDSFKRYQDGRFKGAMLVSSFEAIIPGLLENIDYWDNNKEKLKEHIIDIYTQSQYLDAVRRGVRAVERMMRLISFSRSWFSHEN